MDATTLARPGAYNAAAMAQTDAAHAARRETGDVTRRAILAELARRDAANEPAPSWPELALAVGVGTRTVRYHCAQLRADGLVLFDAGRTRTLRLTPAGRSRA